MTKAAIQVKFPGGKGAIYDGQISLSSSYTEIDDSTKVNKYILFFSFI